MFEAQRVKTLCFFHWPQPFWGFRFRWVNRVCLKQKTGLPASSNPKVARPIRSVAQIYTPTEPLLESKVVTQHMGLGGNWMPMDTSKIQWLIIIFPVMWWLFGGIPPIPHFQPHLTQYLLTILSWWRAAQVFALLAAASAKFEPMGLKAMLKIGSLNEMLKMVWQSHVCYVFYHATCHYCCVGTPFLSP